MTTITEDYVSLEVAKLLKAKGFDIPVNYEYHYKITIPQFHRKKHNFNGIEYKNCQSEWYSAPTQQMAMKWLREVHHIEISITFGFPFIDGREQYKYFWSIVKVYNNHLEYPFNNPNNTTYSEEIADSYEQACEAAIKYCLKHLI